jgi:hypothetical protein
MKSKTYLWEVVDDEGVGLTGFKSENEAQNAVPSLKTDRTWHIRSYVAPEWQTNY